MSKHSFVRITLISAILCMAISSFAESKGAHWDAILSGRFNAKTLSAAVQDSILGDTLTGRYRLEYENPTPLFRHSFEADWYLVDTEKHTRKRLTEGRARDAIMSPNGRYIAFAKGMDLYIYKIDFGTEVAVNLPQNPYELQLAKTNTTCFHGITDWLYEEEFGVTHVMAFSPDSKMLAYLRLDEKEVPLKQWLLYDNACTIDSLHYPRAGEKNAQASVCVYDIQLKTTRTMRTHQVDEDCYLPRLRWTMPREGMEQELLVLKLNRDQTRMEVLKFNPKTTLAAPFYREESKEYFMDYSLWDEWLWLSDGRFIALSEVEGWRQAWLCSAQGVRMRALTPPGRDVTALYYFDETTQMLYYQEATTPQTRQAFAYNLRKDIRTRLTQENGTHQLRFAANGQRYIDCYQSLQTPPRYTLYQVQRDGSSKAVKVLEDNAALAARWLQAGLPEKEFFTIRNSRGDSLCAWLLRPTKHSINQKLPVVITQYSGPQSQRVLNTWRKRFEYALAEAGFAVVCVDPRGTDCRGRAWRNATYMHLGEYEADDQLALASWLTKQDWVDSERIAMIGWSYGGYQVLRTMEEQGRRVQTGQPAPIRRGVAIAPVTDWRFYDSAYTERYMRRPQVNETGYRKADLTTNAGLLCGKVLIMHGTADDNVHYLHTAKMIEALVDAGVDFQLMSYPDDNHFLRKGKHYEDVHRRILSFLQ